MGVYRRGRVWWLEGYRGWKRYRESARTTTCEQALELLDRRRRGRNTARKPSPQFDKWLAQLPQDYRTDGRRDPSRIERAARHPRPPLRRNSDHTASVEAYTTQRLDEGAARADAIRKYTHHDFYNPFRAQSNGADRRGTDNRNVLYFSH